MNRAVNALLVGLTSFIVLAGLVWILFVSPADEGGQPQETTEPTETTETTTTTTHSPTSTRTTTTTTTRTTTTTTTTRAATTTTYAPNGTPPNSTAAGAVLAAQADLRLPAAWDSSIEDASIRFLVGGLMFLTLVLALSVISGLAMPRSGPSAPRAIRLARTLPTMTLDRPPKATSSQLRESERKKGQRMAAAFGVHKLDDVLDGISLEIGGEPRFIRLLEDLAVVRLYQCPECSSAALSPNRAGEGCARIAGFLEGGFERLEKADVEVVETACRAQGSPVCEFEVRQ